MQAVALHEEGFRGENRAELMVQDSLPESSNPHPQRGRGRGKARVKQARSRSAKNMEIDDLGRFLCKDVFQGSQRTSAKGSSWEGHENCLYSISASKSQTSHYVQTQAVSVSSSVPMQYKCLDFDRTHNLMLSWT